ncbi:MAG: DNA-directed DNA polymerase [Rickettsiales bacterium]|nr:DNA-directed DNA polymerase [Rickettsiales bacterium]
MLHFGSDNPVSWLFLDMNSYFASVEQQLDPRLRGKPVAVVPTDTDATCAIAASYEAKAYGIKTGTMIYEAKQRCPELICVPADHQAYVHYHHLFLKEIDRHVPVAIICSIDEVACELIGREQELSNALRIARDIKQGFRENLGVAIRCSIGLSSNRFLSKVATDMNKPDGLCVLQPDAMPGALRDLELDDLPGIGRGNYLRLQRAGVFTIEQLYHLPQKRCRQIWGSVAGERFWYGLRGVELPDIPTKRRTVGHSHVLAPEFRPTLRAYDVVRRLTLKAGSRLRRLGYYASAMQISLREDYGGPRLRADTRFMPVCDNSHLLHEMRTLWDTILDQHHPRHIKKISITLHELTHADDMHQDLFVNEDELAQTKKLETVSRTMDALNERFGRNTVTIGQTPRSNMPFSGTKVAFTRIPEAQEFHE